MGRISERGVGAITLTLVMTAACAPPQEGDHGSLDHSGLAPVPLALPVGAGPVLDLLLFDDRVVVLTGFPPHVHAFTVEGAHLRSYGLSGNGPGELRNPKRLIPAADVRGVGVWDARGSRVTVYDSVGEFSSTQVLHPQLYGTVMEKITESSYGRPFRMVPDGGGVVRAVYPDGLLRPPDYRRGRLVRGSPESADTVTIVRFSDIVDLSRNVGPVLPPIPLWDLCRDSGELVLLDPDVPELILGSLGDTSGFAFEAIRYPLPHRRRRLGEDDYRRLLAYQAVLEGVADHLDPERLSAEFERLVPQMVDQSTGFVPPAVDVRCFQDGEIWLQEFDNRIDPLGYGSVWWRRSESGWRRIQLPSRFHLLHVQEGRLWGFVRSELDEEVPAFLDLDDDGVAVEGPVGSPLGGG